MKPILFLNENTLGHSSYLPRYAEEFARHPEYGFSVEMLNVAPLPPEIEKQAAEPFRGAVRLGLGTHYRRWRELASAHAASLVHRRLAQSPAPAAIVVNTQSVALDLPALLPPDLPLFVCLDATFTQLRYTPWFAPNALSRFLQPFTLGDLIDRERALFARAQGLLPWSEPVAESLRRDYRIPPERIRNLPPCLPESTPLARPDPSPDDQPARLLFIGGDFQRKGGPALLECYTKYLTQRAELDVVTQTACPEVPGLRVHRQVRAWSPEWLALWNRADLFVFPSHLETFGIVLLEAHAFGVPVVASRSGAAEDLLAGGRAGWLLGAVRPESIRDAIFDALADPALRKQKLRAARELLEANYRLPGQTRRLCEWLHQVTGASH